MADDDGRDDATLADTLGAFGARPLLEGTPELDAAPPDATPDWHVDEGPTADEGRLGRLTAWVRWAAAPLGFFVFLSALTAYGVLRNREGSDAADSRPAAPMAGMGPAPVATTAAPAPTAPPAATTVPTTAVPAPTTLLGPPAAPSITSPPVTEDPASTVAPATTLRPRYGPKCGYEPGALYEVVINGRPGPRVTADANGCVSVP